MPGMLDSDLDGRFPYTGRIAYVFDPARPEGERFISLQVQGEDGTWADVDDRATYTLAASSYVAGGSDGYDLLRQYIEENGGADMLEDVVDNQVFTAYVKHRAQQQDGELRALPTPTVTIRGMPGREPSAY